MQTRSNEAASQFASPRQFSAPRLSQSSCQELMAFLNAQAKIGNFQPENSSTSANLVNQVSTEGYNPFLHMSGIPKNLNTQFSLLHFPSIRSCLLMIGFWIQVQ